MNDPRPILYIDAAVNGDDVRCYYELPEYLVESIRKGVGGGGTNDTLTFDQALLTFMDEVSRIAAELEWLGLDL